MGTRLKASLEVHAGIIPNSPISDFTKQFHYTAEEYEEDIKPGGTPETSRFQAIQVEADNYAKSLRDPNALNWVRTDWIWY